MITSSTRVQEVTGCGMRVSCQEDVSHSRWPVAAGGWVPVGKGVMLFRLLCVIWAVILSQNLIQHDSTIPLSNTLYGRIFHFHDKMQHI